MIVFCVFCLDIQSLGLCMKKFFDVVVGDEVDVLEPDVFFYLIQVPNGRYKLHGITGNPETQLECEPETRIEHFWPITLKQLQEANQTKLFENDVLNNGPFELSELEEIFEATDFSWEPAEQRRFSRVNNSGQLSNISAGNLAALFAAIPSTVTSLNLGAILNAEPLAVAAAFAGLAGLAESQHLLDAGFTDEDIQGLSIEQKHSIAKPACLQALADGFTSVEQLKNMTHEEIDEALEESVFPTLGTGPGSSVS
jgi:hypothetical protein